MKQIEFRAWTGKKFIYEIILTSAHGIRLISPNDLSPHEMSDDKVVFMQYTGFRDKRGVKIFDGDIVRDNILGSSIEGFKDNIGKIYQSEYGTWLWKRPKNEIDEIGGGEPIYSLLDDCEIIGNIYE